MSYFGGIQALRAVAAALVVAFHLHAASVNGGHTTFSWFSNGEIGVDVFFVISGFIIYIVATQKTDLTAREFLAARFWRIFPPYWAVLAVRIAIVAAGIYIFGRTDFALTMENLVVSVFLLPYPGMILIVAWTLAMELLFYLVFCASYFSGGKALFWVAMVAWCALGQIMTYVIKVDIPALVFITNSVSLEFLLGAIVAQLTLWNIKRFRQVSLLIGGTLIALLAGEHVTALNAAWSGSVGREYIAGLPAMLLVYGALGISIRPSGLVGLLGDASYLLYLIHLPLFSIIGQVALMVFDFDVYSSTWSVVALFILAHLVAVALHLLGERPYQRWYRSRKARSISATG